MARFLVHHRHAPSECGVAFAAWKGHESPLRRGEAMCSCRAGGHDLWWVVDAPTARDALDLLPFFVAERASASEIAPVRIP